MNIADLLGQIASSHPEKTAIVDRKRRLLWSYATLDDKAYDVAAALIDSGLQPGDRVLVAVPMSANLYATLIGIWRAGLVAVVPDAAHGFRKLNDMLADADVKAIVAAPRFAPLLFLLPALRKVRTKLGFAPFPGLRRIAPVERSPGFVSPEVQNESPALLTFTSGSTGKPKRAVRTHGLLRAQMDAILANVTLGGTALETMPIVMLANLAAGGTSVIPRTNLRAVGKTDPAVLAVDIESEHCDTIIASPAVLERLVQWHQETKRTLPTLRHVFSGGAPVFPRLLAAMRTLAPNATVIAVYGSTEAEPIAHDECRELDDLEAMRTTAGLLVGKPVPEAKVRIVANAWGSKLGPFSSIEFDALSLPTDVAGEILVSGAHVLPGYDRGLGDEETKVSVDGQIWHRTGDLGRFDNMGRLWLLGRANAVIQTVDGPIYPLAVECALSFHPEVRRSALIEHNSQCILFVETDKLVREMAEFAGVDTALQVNSLPVDKRHNAKIDYPALREMAQQILTSKKASH